MICRQKDDKAYHMYALALSLALRFKWHCLLKQVPGRIYLL